MARNPIQFQPGLSLPAFLEQYGTEAKCQDALFQHRWPRGFECPDCGNTTGCRLARGLYQCHRCRHQTSLTAGTIFHATHLPLTTWFLAIYLLTQRKSGISALALPTTPPGSSSTSSRLSPPCKPRNIMSKYSSTCFIHESPLKTLAACAPLEWSRRRNVKSVAVPALVSTC